MRLCVLPLVAALAAGCAGSGDATPKPQGFYVARVTVHGQTANVWLDAGTGRYRSTSATPIGHGAPRAEPDMSDTTVTITRRARVAPAGLLVIPETRSTGRVSEVKPGVVPEEEPTAYWLGPRWRHRPALYAAESTQGSHRDYAVFYRGVSVDSVARQDLHCDATSTTLLDGTLAGVTVLHAGLDGSFGCGLASESPDEVLLFGGSMLGSTIVMVTTPTETIELTGPGLTPQNAVSLARALRPVARALRPV